MTDEMTVPDHPHADQRNWQPGDTDDDGDPAAMRRFRNMRRPRRPRSRNNGGRQE
jgi:hypothetical protein